MSTEVEEHFFADESTQTAVPQCLLNVKITDERYALSLKKARKFDENLQKKQKVSTEHTRNLLTLFMLSEIFFNYAVRQ